MELLMWNRSKWGEDAVAPLEREGDNEYELGAGAGWDAETRPGPPDSVAPPKREGENGSKMGAGAGWDAETRPRLPVVIFLAVDSSEPLDGMDWTRGGGRVDGASATALAPDTGREAGSREFCLRVFSSVRCL